MEIKVKSWFQKGSARKIRPILEIVRNKQAQKAMEILKFANKNGSEEIYKMIKNGITVAEENDLDLSKIFVKNIQCDKAKELKRHRYESKGVARRLKKHQHHIILTLNDLAKPSERMKKDNPDKDK